MLLTVPQFQKKHFEPGSEPSLRTVKRWIDQGLIVGEKIGGTWYIEANSFRAPNKQLVQRVLAG